MRKLFCVLLLVALLSCQNKSDTYTILGNFEEPQNQIAQAISTVLNKHLSDSMVVVSGVGSLANLDSIEAGRADFGIIDNHSRFSDKVASVMPLYPQLLHILYRKSKPPGSLQELFKIGKVFAGIEGSGTRRFVKELMSDLSIPESECTFVDIYNFFEADVIFTFTDLLTNEELRDLKGYHLFSLDSVSNLGRGSLAESICTRHPQFEPYVIARNLYGTFTEHPILTIKVDAILVCRSDLDPAIVYKVNETLSDHNQDLKNINPLMYRFASDFDPRALSYTIHPGAKQFLDRHEPTFFERYAELISVLITVFVAIASAGYSITRWQRQRKKNKIDIYYQQLIAIRNRALTTDNLPLLDTLASELHKVQEETVNLVTREKLLADDSYIIFLKLSKIIDEEIERVRLRLLA